MSRRRVDIAGVAERMVKGAIAGGLEPGSFEVRWEDGKVRLLPCARVEPKDDLRPNSMDALIFR